VAAAAPKEETAPVAAAPEDAPAKPKRRTAAPKEETAPVAATPEEATAKPKRRKAAKSTEPEDAGEVAP
jgi:hypothetical protein